MMLHLAGKSSQSSLSEFQADDVQPNAIDVRLDKVFSISVDPFIIDEDEKVHRGIKEISPNVDGYFVLTSGVYQIKMEGIISMGETEAGWIITRSTLNRNGLHITTGLYDSGYEGGMIATLHVNCGMAKIKKGTRVGQFLLFDAVSLKNYEGDYGKDSAHDEKYGE